MENLEIGIATMNYDDKGRVKDASFLPTMKLDVRPDVLIQLSSIHGDKNTEVIKENAELILGAWFSKTNEIELADRNQYEVVSEIVKCVKSQNGTPKTCVIRFVFKER